MLQFVAKVLTRKAPLVICIALLLLIPSAIGFLNTRVNYDLLSYLPEDLDSTKGQKVLEDTFHNAATTMLVVENMPERYTEDLREKIERVEGVNKAIWVSSLLDISVPKEILPDDIRDIFFSGDDATLIIIQYEYPGASEATMNAIDEIRGLCNTQCFLGGVSVFLKDTKDLVVKEMPVYVVVAAILSMLAMCLTLEAWILPAVFILDIGFAIAYNFGTNFMLGEISYITQAIAAILQLGVTVDYSIFLVNRYIEEKPKFADRRDAMASAIVNAFVSLSGSSATTIAGFLALCFMRLGLGRDIGLVMAKGVVFGIITVVMLLPSLILVFDRPIQKYRHRSLIPDFSWLNERIIKHKNIYVALFLILFLPAVYCQSKTQVYYNIDQAMPADLPSTVGTNELKDKFNMATTHFIIVDDGIPAAKLERMAAQIEEVPGIEAVLSYNRFLGAAIPEEFIPQEIRDICKTDGKQMMMVNSRYKAATAEENAQIESLTGIIKAYDPQGLLTGEGAMTKDLTLTMDNDFRVTNIISIAAILLIVALSFKSLTVPVILVAAIELSIFINMGIPYLTGEAIPFISPTVISCIQLGATVDYAILMTTRFREELQTGKGPVEAIRVAANTSAHSIITSALVLFCATTGVSFISKLEIIKSICGMLARGAIISALVSMFILPSLLLRCEGIISRTSLNWRTPKVKKGRGPRPAKRLKQQPQAAE